MKKIKLLDKLIQEEWFETKEEILPWIMEGKILVDNTPAHSYAEMVMPNSSIRVKEYYKRKYVSKGGIKLEHALITFGVEVLGRVVLDCGASTGGFTDCLLSFGARLVYAVDAGFGQLSQKLINSDKVINLENTNISDKQLLALSEKPDLITLDLSYLSIKNGILIATSILDRGGEIVALIKPIYETEQMNIRRNGDINQYEIHYRVIEDIVNYCINKGLYPVNLTYSPVRGNGGAVEYFIHISTEAREYLDNKKIEKVIHDGLNLPFFKK